MLRWNQLRFRQTVDGEFFLTPPREVVLRQAEQSYVSEQTDPIVLHPSQEYVFGETHLQYSSMTPRKTPTCHREDAKEESFKVILKRPFKVQSVCCCCLMSSQRRIAVRCSSHNRRARPNRGFSPINEKSTR
jgi:hypothetical protein